MILLYGSKDLDSITFREELEALKARLNLTLVHVLSDPPAGWTGEQGYFGAAVFRRYLPPLSLRKIVFGSGIGKPMIATGTYLSRK